MSYEGAELVGIVDPDSNRLAAAHDAFDVPAFGSLEELLATTNVDGVVVATTSASHYTVARQALQAGLHVMVEKPMVFRASEAWELVQLARDADLVLQVGYTHHYTRSAQRLHEVITGGGIGEILQVSSLYATMVESYYRGRPNDYDKVFHFPITGPSATTYSDPAVAGGGQGMTQVSHLIGMVLWATGLRATEVSAFMENTDLAVDLVDAMAFRLDNGAIGTVGSTGNLRPGEPQQQEIRYYGSRGYALQDLVLATIEIHYADGQMEKIAVEEAGDPYPAFSTARGLADSIEGRGPNVAPGDAGAMAVEFLEAAYASAASNQHVLVQALTGVNVPARSSEVTTTEVHV
jgi:predicted dehydrogenase